MGLLSLETAGKPRRCKSALVTSPGGAATTELDGRLKGGQARTVIPMSEVVRG